MAPILRTRASSEMYNLYGVHVGANLKQKAHTICGARQPSTGHPSSLGVPYSPRCLCHKRGKVDFALRCRESLGPRHEPPESLSTRLASLGGFVCCNDVRRLTLDIL